MILYYFIVYSKQFQMCTMFQLSEAPEGKWSCPICERDGPTIVEEEEDDEHMDVCRYSF